MKLLFEKILPSENASWRYWLYQSQNIPFNWHYHPEYEIALTIDSEGQRYVGDNIESYDQLDLALLGPHLPHTWCSAPNVEGKPQQVYVAQIPAPWLESLILGMPDLASLKSLLDLAKRGVTFSLETKKKAALLFADMEQATATDRFIGLLQVLTLMAQDEHKKVLATNGYQATIPSEIASKKLDKAIRYIHEHYTQQLKAEDVAAMLHMSTNHFHRFFKTSTEQTFTQVVNQLRISKACSLLINTRMPINTVSDTCGFNNIANFNRRFLQFKRITPSEFRKIYANKIV